MYEACSSGNSPENLHSAVKWIQNTVWCPLVMVAMLERGVTARHADRKGVQSLAGTECGRGGPA